MKNTCLLSEKLFTDYCSELEQTDGIMGRIGVHKTTHLHRVAFAGEEIYEDRHENFFVPFNAKIQRGCRVASAVLKAAEDPKEQDYLNRIVTPALLGSAWQDAFIGDRAPVPNDLMYRVVELPRLDLIKDPADAALKTWLAGLVHVEAAANHQPFSYSQINIDKRIISLARTNRVFRSMASASLWLGAVDIGRQIEHGWLVDPQLKQIFVRESGYEMTRTTVQLAHKIGSLPSLSQLTDAYSPLTVELMRTGPSHLRDSYLEAIEPIEQAA